MRPLTLQGCKLGWKRRFVAGAFAKYRRHPDWLTRGGLASLRGDLKQDSHGIHACTRDPGLIWFGQEPLSVQVGSFETMTKTRLVLLMVSDEPLDTGKGRRNVTTSIQGYRRGTEAVGCCTVVLMEKQKRTASSRAGELLDRHCISSSASQPKVREGRSWLKQMRLETATPTSGRECTVVAAQLDDDRTVGHAACMQRHAVAPRDAWSTAPPRRVILTAACMIMRS